MTNNDVLRRLRYALNIKNTAIIEIYKLAGVDMDEETLDRLLKRDDEDGYVECNAKVLEFFLDGLIISKRGVQEARPGQANKPKPQFSNNTILRKLRIAFELKENDMLEILELGEMSISKSELSAMFRSETHRNYVECQGQMLRKFLSGLNLFLKA